MITIFYTSGLPMTDINKLKEEELQELNKPSVEVEEVGLEDLIVLGERKKIPIHIIYPNEDGTKEKAKALVRQLTLKEVDALNFNSSVLALNITVLRKALFKTNGERFSNDELEVLPLGVVNAVANKILELSGIEQNRNLQDF